MHIILRLLWIMDDYGNCWHVHETAARFAIDRCRSNDGPVVRHSRRFPSMLLEWNVKQSLCKCDFTAQVSPKIVRKDQVIRVYEMVGCQTLNAFRYSICHFYVLSSFSGFRHTYTFALRVRRSGLGAYKLLVEQKSVCNIEFCPVLRFCVRIVWTSMRNQNTLTSVSPRIGVTVMLLLQHPSIIVYASSFQESTTYMRLWVCKKESFSGCFFFQLQSVYQKMYGVSPLFVTYFFCWTCRSPPELIPLATTARQFSVLLQEFGHMIGSSLQSNKWDRRCQALKSMLQVLKGSGGLNWPNNLGTKNNAENNCGLPVVFIFGNKKNSLLLAYMLSYFNICYTLYRKVWTKNKSSTVDSEAWFGRRMGKWVWWGNRQWFSPTEIDGRLFF